MIELRLHDVSEREIRVLESFWRGGFGKAVGFTIRLPPVPQTSYKPPHSQRELAKRITKAIKDEPKDSDEG